MAGARQVVDPPSFTPTPFGLLTTVEWVSASDGHWQNGITYEPTCGAAVTGTGGSTYDACIAVTGTGGTPPTPAAFTNTVNKSPRGATSFSCWVDFECATVGNDAARDVAVRSLAMAEPWQAERAFWTGQAAGQPVVFPHLAATAAVLDAQGILLQTASVNVTGTSIGNAADTTNVDAAVGMLEGALANCYDGVGVLHVPQFMVPTLDAWGIIKQNGAVMRTMNGNKVAIGAGYPGSAPDGTARPAGKAWLYITGNVFGFRSELRTRSSGAQTIDRSTNTQKMIAERTYVIGWDCCPAFAALATIGVPGGT